MIQILKTILKFFENLKNLLNPQKPFKVSKILWEPRKPWKIFKNLGILKSQESQNLGNLERSLIVWKSQENSQKSYKVERFLKCQNLVHCPLHPLLPNCETKGAKMVTFYQWMFCYKQRPFCFRFNSVNSFRYLSGEIV